MSYIGIFSFDRRIDQDVRSGLAALARQGQRSAKFQNLRVSTGILGTTGDTQVWGPTAASAPGGRAVFWGRVHNRRALVECLGDALGPKNDAELVWRAYQRWGQDFPNHFNGEFCCALWDEAQQRLLLARDHTGDRALVYYHDGQTLYFATQECGLVALPSVPRAVNETLLASRLLLIGTETDQTGYAGIRRIRPGHVLTWDRHGLTHHRYWRPEDVPPLKLRHDADYAQALRVALERAVERRLPPTGAVVSQLSAGLDSSTVTTLAARALAKQGRSLIACTAVPQSGFDAARRPQLLADEGPLAQLVAQRHTNIEHVLLRHDRLDLINATRQINELADCATIGGPNATWFMESVNLATSRNAGCMLVATAGNVSASYHGLDRLGQLFASGKWLSLTGECLQAIHRGMAPRTLAYHAFGAYTPLWLANLVRRMAGRTSQAAFSDYLFIRPEFAEQQDLAGLGKAMGRDRAHYFRHNSREVRNYMLRMFDPGFFSGSLWRRHGMWYLDPMADKDLVELCFSIPDEQYFHRGEPRSLIKRAMTDLLPPELLHNPRKGRQSADAIMTYKAALPALRAELEKLEANDTARRALDLPRMRHQLDLLATTDDYASGRAEAQNLGLVRAVSAGMFILSVEGSND